MTLDYYILFKGLANFVVRVGVWLEAPSSPHSLCVLWMAVMSLQVSVSVRVKWRVFPTGRPIGCDLLSAGVRMVMGSGHAATRSRLVLG